MYFLQTTTSGVSTVLFLGTLGMVVLTVSLIIFIIFHQRKGIALPE
jgi:two-component system, NarL family, sensor kinase